MTQALASDPAWLKAAFGDLGLKETPGPRSNPRVVEMYDLAGHPEIKDDAVAWCAAAMGAWLVKANLKGTGSLAARSYLNYGRKLPTERIPRGAILIFRRGTSSWQGHVCICLADYGETLVVIGGNQSDAVTIARYPKAALLGARWPETALNSRTLQSGGLSIASLGGQEVAGETATYLEPQPDQIAEGLSQAQEMAMQAAVYLRWAQYALILIGVLSAVYAGYRFIQKRIRPAEIPQIEPGPSIDDPPRRARKRRKKK
jgi:uncharacterized protein (TIGR02594 family)